MQPPRKKSIGIWGFGTVGTSAAHYYINNRNICLGIFDAQPLTDEQKIWCSDRSLRVWSSEDLPSFLEYYDYILPSPGIDLGPYQTYQHKWISEFDIFCDQYKNPIVAITGSIGKTSITHLLSQLLNNAYGSIATGGNIGVGMLDLLSLEQTTMAILELSSFQLDLVQSEAPDLAIITNIYPNHLDRHKTMQAYMSAKSRIYTYQNPQQKVLLPYSLASELQKPASHLYLFSETKPVSIPSNCSGMFFLDNNIIHVLTPEGQKELMSLDALPPITFAQNWLIIVSAAYLLEVDLQLLVSKAATFSLPPHRLECMGTKSGITFYNDSKATTNTSMLAAVNTVAQQKPVHLFMGGLSKGVNREPAIEQLHKNVLHVYCFGKEAAHLHALCKKHSIASSQHATLEDAFSHCMQQVQHGESVLLSPGGASYDLFVDYQDRGNKFKQLIKDYVRVKFLPLFIN